MGQFATGDGSQRKPVTRSWPEQWTLDLNRSAWSPSTPSRIPGLIVNEKKVWSFHEFNEEKICWWDLDPGNPDGIQVQPETKIWIREWCRGFVFLMWASTEGRRYFAVLLNRRELQVKFVLQTIRKKILLSVEFQEWNFTAEWLCGAITGEPSNVCVCCVHFGVRTPAPHLWLRSRGVYSQGDLVSWGGGQNAYRCYLCEAFSPTILEHCAHPKTSRDCGPSHPVPYGLTTLLLVWPVWSLLLSQWFLCATPSPCEYGLIGGKICGTHTRCCLAECPPPSHPFSQVNAQIWHTVAWVLFLVCFSLSKAKCKVHQRFFLGFFPG